MSPSLVSIRLGTVLAGLMFVTGCAQESATSPAIDMPASQVSGMSGITGNSGDQARTILGQTAVTGLQRTTPLASSMTVTRTLGTKGGSLSIPAAGVTVVVPAGALAAPTQITMTARAGSLVAYDFAPHGITFAKPLVFTQQLSGTQATLLNASLLELGYYTDASVLGATSGVASELHGGNVDTAKWSFTAPIHHFSGYFVTCGRGGSDR